MVPKAVPRKIQRSGADSYQHNCRAPGLPMAHSRPEWVSHTVSVDDMTAGRNQWRNIQDIVRVTFKEFHDVLRAQGDAIKSLERAIDSKELGRGGSRSQLPEVEAALRQLKHISSDIGHQLDLRATKADVHAAFKAQEELMSRELARKADAEEVERKVNEMDALLAECVEKAGGGGREGFAIAPRTNSFAPGTARPSLAALTGGGERSMEDLWEAMSRKADSHDVDAALRSKADATSVNKALERLEISQLGLATKEEVAVKSDMKDVCALVDVKVGVDDVNHALAEVSRELELKASAEDLDAHLKSQALVNRGLVGESSLGRWIWKSGQVNKGNGVPWNVQSVNTDPVNFIWERDKSCIVTVAPGLYEVNFGFFVRKKPAIQLLVNGEPVLAAVNSASYVLHHSSGRLTSVGRHPSGNITGLTLIDFLALPAKAKIAITYNGEPGGEGFLTLKKL